MRRARTLEAVSRLAGVVADEYHASLRAIGAFADRAIDHARARRSAARRGVQRAAEQLQRATEFTSGLKAISRQQRGRPARLDLSDAPSRTSCPSCAHAVGAAVLLENVPSREPCVTVIDPAHLRAMLLDLATNARDAMPRGGRWRIETGAVELDADAALGMAIQPGRYARLDRARHRRGHSEGRADAHLRAVLLDEARRRAAPASAWPRSTRIVSQYGGCVNVTSEPGDTAFEILLPSPR